MGDSQFSVGVKVVLDIETERERIGRIPQAVMTSTANVPSMVQWSSTQAGGANAQLAQTIDREVEKILERERARPSEPKETKSAELVGGKQQLPPQDNLDSQKNALYYAMQTKRKISAFIDNPIDTTADLIGAVPVAGAVIKPIIQGGHRIAQLVAGGEGAFVMGLQKAVLDDAAKRVEGNAALEAAFKVVRKLIDMPQELGLKTATTIEAANQAVSPAWEATKQWGGALSRIGMGQQPINMTAAMDFFRGSLDMEYYQAKFGLRRKQWMGQWAGEAVAKGAIDIFRNSVWR